MPKIVVALRFILCMSKWKSKLDLRSRKPVTQEFKVNHAVWSII
jgi:hypothetical protein